MSARLRLTLSYAGFLVVAGAALLAVVFYVIRFIPSRGLSTDTGYAPSRGDILDALWPRTWQVLIVLLAVGLIGGWILSGRMLRPLRRINAVARGVASGTLGQRVRLDGPRDEFRELADTFDSMLDRLEAAFDEQRRFAANASHELRTPYAITRSMLEVAIADPHGRDVDVLLRRLTETNRRGEETVESLLTLSALDHGIPLRADPVDVAELAREVLEQLRPLADSAGIVVTCSLGEGDIDADPVLVRQLIGNLVLNAIRHNTGPGGTAALSTRTLVDGRVELRVVNSGPSVPFALLNTITEPFVRGAGRTADATAAGPRGSGLGLTLVSRIATASGAALVLAAPSRGGLDATVTFRPPA